VFYFLCNVLISRLCLYVNLFSYVVRSLCMYVSALYLFLSLSLSLYIYIYIYIYVFIYLFMSFACYFFMLRCIDLVILDFSR